MMDFGVAQTLLGRFRDLGMVDVGLIGGEPTVYPGVEKLIAHGKSLGLEMTLYSNGRMLAKADYADKIAASGADFVNISVQCGSRHKDRHDQTVKAKGAWDQTAQGIRNCHERGLKLRLQTVLCHTDFDVYRDVLDEFAYTCAKFVFYREIPIVGERMFEYKVLPNADTKAMYKTVYQYALGKGLDTYLFARMPFCWWDKNDPLERAIMDRVVSRCHVLSGQNLIADVNGKALPCPQWIGMHSMDLTENGSVKSGEQILSEWNSGTPQKIRDNLLYHPTPNCAVCEFYGEACTGGCPLVPFELGPFAPNPRQA